MSDSSDRKKTAPYISFSTFQSALDSVANAGVPNIIDRHSFPSFSGGSVAAVLSSFRFFELIGDDGKPSPVLHELATNKDGRQRNIADLLTNYYDTVFELDLMRATPPQLDDAFSNAKYNVTGATRRKSQAFFLKAAAFAGVGLGKLLSSKSRNVSTGRKPRKKVAVVKTGTASIQTPGEIPSGEGIIQGQAIKSVALADSKKTVWLGTDANLVQVRWGRDFEFVAALMKLFDIYERGGTADVTERSGSQPIV